MVISVRDRREPPRVPRELVTGLLAVLSPGMATPGEGSFATRWVSRQGAITTGSFVATLRVENPVRAGLVEAVCADEAVGAELPGWCVRSVLIWRWRATPATELTQVWVRVRSSGCSDCKRMPRAD
jgi:hypothetical protein